MKIVKEGVWEFPFTCTGCKSELVAEMNDVRYTNYEEDNDYYVECPTCGTRHIFKHADKVLPPKVITSAHCHSRRRS